MEYTMEGQGGGRTMEIVREGGGGGGGEMTITRSSTTISGGGGGGSMEIIREGGGGGGEMTMTRTSTSRSGGGGSTTMEGSMRASSKTSTKMLDAAQVATMEGTSMRQESEMDMQTIEEPPRSRRASQQRSAGLPPAGPMRPPVPDLTEVHGPLYPTERRHEFPRDPPPRVESKAKDDFKFPVMVEDGKHSCTEVPKAGEKVSTLTGPVLDTAHHHAFTKEETKSYDVKTLTGPVQSVGVEASHKFNMMESQAKPVDAPAGKEQMYPVMASDHSSKFTGPTTSVKSNNTDVKDIHFPTGINRRKFNEQMSGHGYNEITMSQEAKVSTDLQGPLYDVATVHAFKGIMTHAHKLTEMTGPVFGNADLEVDRKHHYSELGKHAETLKNLSLPVYDVDTKHGYELIMKEAEKLVSIVGPVYPVEHGSKYKPETTKVDSQPMMTGPVNKLVSDSNKYCPVTEKVRSEALMTGPVYPGVEAKNAYNETESARTDVPIQMNAPVYSSVAGGNQYSYEAPKVPEPDAQQFTPTRAGATTESHKYGPVPARVPGVPQVTGPVRVEQGDNKYCPVSERKSGEMAMCGPVYAGVESKRGFSEVKGKADLPMVVSGPCYPADAGHKYSGETLEPKFSVQMGQVYPVLDSGHSHSFREIIASAAAMAGFSVPRHEIDHDKHGYVPQAPVALGTTQEMLGPIYDVMQQHNYGQINTIVNELKTLSTPVYTPESKNHYQNILKNVEKLETLQTPVFDINRDHHFSEIMKSIDSIKTMSGPVYDLGQDSKHSCNEVTKTVDRIKTLAYPVYGVEGKANYNEMEKKVESLKQLASPYYDIGEAKYSFNEIDKALDTVKALNFPILINQDSAHHFNEIAKHAETLKDLIGPVYLSEDVSHKFSVVPP